MPSKKQLQAAEARPRWRGRALWFNGSVVKRFGRPAQDIELLLTAFEEQGWIAWIDDPLPPKPGRDPRRRLYNAIQNFNRRLDCPLLRLRGDGTGTRLGWEPVLSTPLSTPRRPRAFLTNERRR